MRIVILTSVIPYPLEEGGKISQFAVLERLVEHCEVLLLCEVNNKRDLDNIEGLKSRLSRLEVSYFNKIIEPPQLTIAQRLIRKNQTLLSRLENRLNSISEEPKAPTFYELVANCSYMYSPKSLDIVEFYKNEIRSFNPDIIQVEHNGYLTLGIALGEFNIPKLFVEHEIQYARLISNLSILKTISNKLPEYYLLEHIKYEESLFLNAYDHIIVFSINDALFLKKMIQNDNVTNIPFPIVDADFSSPVSNGSAIQKLVFIGAESHYPNKEGVKALIDHLTDDQLDILKMKFYVIGKWSDDTIRQYSNRKNIVFTGYVEDLNIFCKGSLMLAPIRIGSGIRTKILYGMAQGIPVLTTDLGCEGILVENNKSIIVENDLNKWNIKIDELINNDSLRNRIVSEAYQIAVQHYSQNAVIKNRMSLYEHLIKK